MDRRNFLQAMSAALVAAGIPTVSAARADQWSAEELAAFATRRVPPMRFNRLVVPFDYGHALGVGVESLENNVRRRVGARFVADVWHSFTADQQEVVWGHLEAALTNVLNGLPMDGRIGETIRIPRPSLAAQT